MRNLEKKDIVPFVKLKPFLLTAIYLVEVMIKPKDKFVPMPNSLPRNGNVLRNGNLTPRILNLSKRRR
jgi:hypothetical protein